MQTLSHTCVNLLREAPALAAAGVGALRLSPQRCDMVAVAQVFRDVLDGRSEADAGNRMLARLYLHAAFANGFIHGAPGAEMVS